MNKRLLLAFFVVLACLVSGCASLFPDPMKKAEVTMVPGVTAALHSPLANENNRNLQTATLYFRFGREPMLASEAREISISQNESAEKAVVQALLDGPGAGASELSRLFPEQVQVLSVVPQDGILYVTFNDALLRPYSDEPGDWQTRREWQNEVPLRRRLAMAGLTATITENFPYQSVQVLVQQRGDVSTSLRLENAYFHSQDLPGGLAAPFRRDESLLLTQRNTVLAILGAWQEKDWNRLYLYVSSGNLSGTEERPSTESAILQWDRAAALTKYEATGGSVSHDGNRAVVDVNITLAQGDEPGENFADWPVMLTRDRGIWKISFEQLTALMKIMPAKEDVP